MPHVALRKFLPTNEFIIAAAAAATNFALTADKTIAQIW